MSADSEKGLDIDGNCVNALFVARHEVLSAMVPAPAQRETKAQFDNSIRLAMIPLRILSGAGDIPFPE